MNEKLEMSKLAYVITDHSKQRRANHNFNIDEIEGLSCITAVYKKISKNISHFLIVK